MTREEALARLHEIVVGIDRDEDEEHGWWETSTGAKFGGAVLAELVELVEALTEPPVAPASGRPDA